MSRASLLALCLVAPVSTAILGAPGAMAQDKGTLSPRALPPINNPEDPRAPAKQVFGRETEPSATAPHVYGFYAKGCLAGGRPLPLDGPAWQVMRPSRDRYWGHPRLIDFVERLADRVRHTTHWPGLLIGDMSQPRGGPMLSGHASHQIGLDVDIWLRPMPERTLTNEEREFMESLMVVREDRKDVDPHLFTPDTLAVIRAAAKDPEVQRIFVNAAIKKAICREARGDRSWLDKVRPMYGHDYHFHVRLFCPAGETACQHQAEVPEGDGCGKALDGWFKESILHPKPKRPWPPMPPMSMAALPDPCRAVATAPGQQFGER